VCNESMERKKFAVAFASLKSLLNDHLLSLNSVHYMVARGGELLVAMSIARSSCRWTTRHKV
jgi:hypothetical protein